MAATYGKLPLSFEANQGQTDKQVKFLSRGSGYELFLTPTEAVLSLKAASDQRFKKASFVPVTLNPKSRAQATVLRIRLKQANHNAKVSGIDELPGKRNYFIGNDPKEWRTNVPTYARVKYANVYPGVDLVYYGNQRQLEYDFVLAPGADPRQIQLSFAGAERLRLDRSGNLIVNIGNGEIVEHAGHLSGYRRCPAAGGRRLRAAKRPYGRIQIIRL